MPKIENEGVEGGSPINTEKNDSEIPSLKNEESKAT